MANGEERDETEVIEWFKSQLEVKSPKKLARELGVNKSTVTRNRSRVRMGKRLATPFRRRCERRMDGEEREAEEKAAADEIARQEGIAREREAQRKADREAKEKVDRVEEEAAAKKEEEEERRQQEEDEAWEEELQSWEEKLRAAGYVFEWAEGDASDLLIAGITKFGYVDVGTAAVALLPDDVVLWRDKTAAYFREGVSYTLRLQERAIRNGQTPEMIGNFPASDVYYDALPDQLWRYGEEGVKVIAEWRELTDAYGNLATGELPAFVHPKTVAAFERLISIEETSGYDFKDSRLGPDARDRLKRLQRRATLPSIGLKTAGMTWSACESAAIWIAYEGVALLGVILLALLAVGVGVGLVFGIGWGLVQLWNWATYHWTEIGLTLLTVAALAALVGMAYCWVKEADSGWAIAGRIGVIVGLVLAVVTCFVALLMIGKVIHDLLDALQSGV